MTLKVPYFDDGEHYQPS